MHAANPEALPYFSYPGTGQNAVQRSITGNYSPGWDLVNFATLGAAKAYHYLLDKQSAQLEASSQNVETWNTTTTTDPDKIQLMNFAYEKAFGIFVPGHDQALWGLLGNAQSGDIIKPKSSGKEEEQDKAVKPALATRNADQPPKVMQITIPGNPGFPLDYYGKVYPGWFFVGSKCDVPKDACYVGHCGKTYAWVMPNQTRDLANFTLAILDIATYQSSGTRNAPSGSFGYPTLPRP